jgi:hypothetical protein
MNPGCNPVPRQSDHVVGAHHMMTPLMVDTGSNGRSQCHMTPRFVICCDGHDHGFRRRGQRSSGSGSDRNCCGGRARRLTQEAMTAVMPVPSEDRGSSRGSSRVGCPGAAAAAGRRFGPLTRCAYSSLRRRGGSRLAHSVPKFARARQDPEDREGVSSTKGGLIRKALAAAQAGQMEAPALLH